MNPKTRRCFYPLEMCTADEQFVFAVYRKSFNPEINPASLSLTGDQSCLPVLCTPDYAIFKFPVTGCGTRTFVVGETRVYLAEVQSLIQRRQWTYGLVTSDRPFRQVYRQSPASIAGASSAVCDVNIDPSRVLVRFGDPVTVSCSTTREDVLAAGWESSVSPVYEPDSKIAVWNVSSLTVWDAEPKCFINYMNEPRQRAEKLDLVIYKYPESVSLIAPEFMKIGVESSITCQVLDVAPVRYLSVKLYKGDEQLGNRSFTHDSTRFPANESVPFPVTPTRADNGAEYTCVAELQLGPGGPKPNPSKRSPPLKIPVVYKPSLLSADEENVEVREGGSIVLKCSADGSPAPTYEWKYPKADNVQEIMKDGVSTVNITRASSSNARVYECHAKNTYGVATKNITLTVKEYPESVSLIAPEFMKIGVESSITCQVLDVAPARYLSVKLYKGDEQLVNRSFTHDSTRFPVNEIVPFPVTPTRADNGAEYTCVAELQLGPGGPKLNPTKRSPPLKIPVVYKPSLLSAAEENVEVREGGSIVLKCSADGSPAPTYEWKYPKADNVQEITKDGVSTVNITRASSSNARVYECHAKNIHGVVTKNITLNVSSDSAQWGNKHFQILDIFAVRGYWQNNFA
ncbi:UNVERIFIED_CONTAM: hypothetical protein FKN15_011393 [Acipenser sinensis]